MKKYMFCFLGGSTIETDKMGDISNLKSIDDFTSKFTSEQKLKAHILEHTRTQYPYVWEMSRKLKLKCIDDEKEFFIPIIYSNDKEYINRGVVKHKFFCYASQREFLYRLASFYSKSSGSKKSWVDKSLFAHRLEWCLNQGTNHELSILLNENLEEIYRRTTDYTGTRILGLFIRDYETELKLRKQKSEENSKKIEDLKKLRKEVSYNETQEDEYQQLTFSDLNR